MNDERLPLDPPATVRVFRPDRFDEFDDFLVRSRPYLAIDTETTGLAWGDTVRTVQVGDGDEAWVIPADEAAVVRHVLARCRWFIAWNAPFDATHLARLLAVPFDDLIARFYDTGIYAGVHDPRMSFQGGVGRGLKEWARHVCGPVAGSFEVELKKLFRSRKVSWATVDSFDPVMVRYAGSDPILTYRVHRHLVPLIEDRADIVRREQRAMQLLARMRQRGLAIDADRAETARVGYRQAYAGAMADLSAAGVTSVFKNLEVVGAIEAEGYGRLLTGKTPKGAVQVDKAALGRCAGHGSKVAGAVLVAKKQKKFADYAEKFAAAGAVDGRVHASIRSIGAKSRRMAVSGPQLQQVPKKEHALRAMFATPPGRALVRADYNSMELRYMAHVSGDANLIADLEAGAAIFEELGFQVFGDPDTAEEAAWQRSTAKIAVYGTCYGAGITKVAAIIGRPEWEADKIRSAWWARYPDLEDLFYEMRDSVEGAGGVELPLTGWLPSSRDFPHVGLNLLVQGGCRDAFVERLLALDEAGLRDVLVLPIHDELLLEVDDGDVREAGHVLQTVMPITWTRVPIPVEASTAPSWGEAYQAESMTIDDPAAIEDDDMEADEAREDNQWER